MSETGSAVELGNIAVLDLQKLLARLADLVFTGGRDDNVENAAV